MKNHSIVRRFILGMAVACCAPPLIAIAAEPTEQGAADNPPPSESEQARPEKIEPIIVTATKLARSVREIPVSIDAFAGDDLVERGLSGLEDILKYSPGVTFKKSAADSDQIIIRGSGSNSANWAFNRPFGLFYEDVPLVNPTLIGAQPDVDPFDLRTVEVLKGPQGTLFGGSALVGAVRYVPIEPNFEKSEASVGYGYGWVADSDDANSTYTLMLNQPLGDRFAVRLTGSLRDHAGYIEDTFSGSKDINTLRSKQGRIQVAWMPVDDLSIRLSHLAREVYSGALTGNTIDNVEGRLEQSRLRGSPDGTDSDMSITGLRIEWSRFEPFTLVWNSNFMPKDATFITDFGEDTFLLPVGSTASTWSAFDTTSDQVTHELRIASNRKSTGGWLMRDWEYVAGVFYMSSDQAFQQDNIDDAVTSQIILIARASADAEESALFFDLNRWFLDDRLQLNLGGRYFKQETPMTVGVTLTTEVDGERMPEMPIGSTNSDTLDEEDFNPKVALTWAVRDNLSVYASAVKGFRFGGLNADPFLTGEPPIFYESDELWNYELGIRSEWLDDRLQLDATIFQIDWENRQLPLFTSSQPRTQFISNIGGSEIRGAELSLRALLPNNFSVLVNGAYVDSRVTEAFEAPTGDVAAGALEPNSPYWTGALILSSDTQWGDWQAGGSLSYSYTGSAKSSFQNFAPLDAINLVDMSLSLTNTQWRMRPEFFLNVLNLTDSRALLNADATLPVGDPGRIETALVATPRTVTLGLRLNF